MAAVPNQNPWWNPFGWRRKNQPPPPNVTPLHRTGPNAAEAGKMTPQQFLEQQILNLPDEEESVQKRLLLSIAYFACTWGGSVLMIILGVGLAQDLQTIVQVSGAFAFALALLFPFAEFCFEILAILVGERIHQGLKTQGDYIFVLAFGLLVLLANASSAMLQVFLLQHAAAGHGAASADVFESAVLWFRAFLPLAIVIATIGVCAGIQRRSVAHMIKAIERKTTGINQVALATVKYMEAEVSIKRLVDEHQELKEMREKKDQAAEEFFNLMKQALEEKLDRLRKYEDDDKNGRNGRY